jgi:hypothetical protein
MLENGLWPSDLSNEKEMRQGALFLERPEFRTLHERVKDARLLHPNDSDFDLIVHAIRLDEKYGAPNRVFDCWTLAERYIALVYSIFDKLLTPRITPDLPWAQWFTTYSNRLGMAVSLNYDRVLETYRSDARARPFRTALHEEIGRLPIIKPHGSIDFGPDVVRKPASNGYVMRGLDIPQRLLSDDQMLAERIETNIVVPSALTHMRKRQHVESGYQQFKKHGPAIKTFVMIGVSYCRVDRPEIDEFFDSLSSDCTVIFANPSPPPHRLEQSLAFRELKMVHWPHGPKAL